MIIVNPAYLIYLAPLNWGWDILSELVIMVCTIF